MVDFKPKIDEPQDNRHPLIKFSGVLKDYSAEEVVPENGNRKFMRISFNFSDVKVLESREPYNFPIATVAVPYSERGNSFWAILAKSIRSVLPENDIDLLVGKEQTWHWADCIMQRPNTEGRVDAKGRVIWEDQPSHAWQVVEVGGQSSSEDVFKLLAEMADGKTEPEFYAAVFSNEELKKSSGFANLTDAVINRTLVSTLDTLGLVKETDGKLVKV